MNIPEPDEKLILQMAEGNKDAFRDLYSQTSGAIYGFALSILRNHQDAENVMHDAFIRIYRSASTYRPMGKPMAWILTIVKRLCFTRLKTLKISEDISDYENILPASGNEQTLDGLILRETLELLSFKERQIVILHALTGMKHREIAELLDMPEGTVTSKYKRALEKMRKELEKGEER
jgi:RNA polymerase sigma factor (sigma-70 family)